MLVDESDILGWRFPIHEKPSNASVYEGKLSIFMPNLDYPNKSMNLRLLCL